MGKSRSKGQSTVNMPFEIQYFREGDIAPAREVIKEWPPKIRARIVAVLEAVASAPPTRFSGGGMWEAMHGEMSGWFEVRQRGRDILYRVFCQLDTTALDPDDVHGKVNYSKSVLAVIDAGAKANESAFDSRFYDRVRARGALYNKTNPRPWL